MNSPIIITSCLDRVNIAYACFSILNNCESLAALNWVVNDLNIKKNLASKYIIYCKSIDMCTSVYSFFDFHLSNVKYVGSPSFRSQLFLMFHHSTPSRNKEYIEASFQKPDSLLRVIIATVAFGLGVDVPDVDYVINWGCPKLLETFAQESGRAGRDGRQAKSIVYYRSIDFIGMEKGMKDFCTADSTCRREIILKYFGGCIDRHAIGINCCDNCEKLCVAMETE